LGSASGVGGGELYSHSSDTACNADCTANSSRVCPGLDKRLDGLGSAFSHSACDEAAADNHSVRTAMIRFALAILFAIAAIPIIASVIVFPTLAQQPPAQPPFEPFTVTEQEYKDIFGYLNTQPLGVVEPIAGWLRKKEAEAVAAKTKVEEPKKNGQ
jgi:hypothetical protein